MQVSWVEAAGFSKSGITARRGVSRLGTLDCTAAATPPIKDQSNPALKLVTAASPEPTRIRHSNRSRARTYEGSFPKASAKDFMFTANAAADGLRPPPEMLPGWSSKCLRRQGGLASRRRARIQG